MHHITATSLLVLVALASTVSGLGKPAPLEYNGNFCMSGAVVTMDCPVDYVIELVDAQFGLTEESTCNNAAGVTCELRDVVDTLKEKCEGQNNCSFAVDESIGSHCPGVDKDLRLVFYCIIPVQQITQCPGDPGVRLSCPAGRVVRVVNSFWGLDSSRAVCRLAPGDDATTCSHPDAGAHVERFCQNKQNCSLCSDGQLNLADRCPEVTKKHLQVEYVCAECMNNPEHDSDCEQWAAGGQCEANPGWMTLNCRKSCWKCERTQDTCEDAREECTCAAMFNQPCPACVCEDTMEDCVAWASTGECEANPVWMAENCKKSCKECVEENTEGSQVDGRERGDSGAACVNLANDTDCQGWADTDECITNRIWMTENCKRSCQRCGELRNCNNKYGDDEKCEVFAEQGECTKNPDWMHAMCEEACGACRKHNETKIISPDGKSTETCQNLDADDDKCERYSRAGECSAKPGWMLINCRKACGECKTSSNTIHIQDITTAECVNRNGNNTKCELYARQGECEANPNWMLYYCRRACNVCDDLQQTEVTITSLCVNTFGNNTACNGWATEGYCSTSPTWMSQNCQRSCGLCYQSAPIPRPQPPKYSPCYNKFGDDTKCRNYVLRGECEKNPGWMLENCQKSCGACSYRSGLIPTDSPCVNVYGNNTQCEDFSRRGECQGNPNWMVPNCGAACGACRGTADVTSRVFFDISIGGESVGRIVFGLIGNVAPLTAGNFQKLAEGFIDTNGQKLWYKDSIFHRVIKDFMIQGGDIVSGNGLGFRSTFGGHFDDENFVLRNYGPGWLGMANRGPDTNGCQIYITTANTPWLNGKHVVFGKVLEGMDVVRAIETNPTDESDRPIKDAVVSDSGVLPLVRPFSVTRAAIYEAQ